MRKIMDCADHKNVGVTWRNSNGTDVKNGSVKESFDLLSKFIRCCHINELIGGYPYRELFSLLRGHRLRPLDAHGTAGPRYQERTRHRPLHEVLQGPVDRTGPAPGAVRAPASVLAKEIKFIEKFKARASHAAQVQAGSRSWTRSSASRPRVAARRCSSNSRAPRSGEDVISLKGVHKGYGEQPIYQDLDFWFAARSAGPCWAPTARAKSTLLKLVAEATEPDQGKVAIEGGA